MTQVARDRFGAVDGATGAVHTRTGRSFFPQPLTEVLLGRLRMAVTDAGFWGELGTDWILLDAELLPWSAKAEDLLRHHYATVGAAANAALHAAVAVSEAAKVRGLDVDGLLSRTTARAANAQAFTAAYRPYVWPTDGLDGIQLAPFQRLASEGKAFSGHDHSWHLALADRLIAVAPGLIRSTRRVLVDPSDPASVDAGVHWWEDLAGAGGEGMVVKPLANRVKANRGYAQPGTKVRGREYLRIICGPDYTEAANLEGCAAAGSDTSAPSAPEYALGIELLERAARREPLWRSHEPVFAALALESAPVDPRR